MRQILQNLSSGDTELVEVPCPADRAGHLLIATRASLVSAGTERMLVEFGRASLLDKARMQPEKVKQVLAKIKTDGFFSTLEAVRSKLGAPIPLGYCHAGVVIGVGKGVKDFSIGDRVISNGPHAEVVSVPTALCAHIPNEVTEEEACFTVAAAIALQGIRLAMPTLGERFVVTGLGLIGLLTVQLLKAHGCEVLGLDFDAERLTLAASFGASVHNLANDGDPLSRGEAFTGGGGVDGVIITASTTSNDPVHHAAQLCRVRGRIILVGVTGLSLNRSDFYAKEISFQVSCSYGPGRYDRNYEELGQDYPFGFVRWTEGRNFQAVLTLLKSGALSFSRLITHRIPFDSATEAYRLLTEDRKALGIVLHYPRSEDSTLRERCVSVIPKANPAPVAGSPVLGVIGSGNYAARVLIPAFTSAGALIRCVVSGTGLSSTLAARSNHIEFSSTDLDALFGDREINTLVIATRHNTHASLVCRALKAGKHVFVEKPLALTREELNDITTCYAELAVKPLLVVGFNRRYSPHVLRLREWLAGRSCPASMIMTVNAGAIPESHWTQDPSTGGGRLIGEACHFIDLLTHLSGGRLVESHLTPLMTNSGPRDTFTLTLKFSNGSNGTVHYLTNGHALIAKERLEIYCGGQTVQLDNFRRLKACGVQGLRSMNLWRQDKGQKGLIRAFLSAITSQSPSPTPLEELIPVHSHCFALNEVLHS